MIDFGAGTGTFALAAAPLCKRMIAVDISPAMVETMRTRLVEGAAANVECVQAGLLSYEHAGALVDFIYTRNTLHHLPDFWKAIALSRMADLLRPDGILRVRDLVFSFELDEAEARIAEWIESAAVERPEHGWTREELMAHVRDEFSTFSWLLEPMIEQAGFEIVAADYGAVGAYAAYTCSLARRR
jgi:SAM-dependent methyltransferase